MIPATELAAMRTELDKLLPDTCDIMGMTSTNDGAGNEIQTWEIVTASVPCRMDFIAGNEAVITGELKPFTRAVLTLAWDTVITEQNRVSHGGNTYTVQAVNLGSWLGVKRASVEIIDYGGVPPTPASINLILEDGTQLIFE